MLSSTSSSVLPTRAVEYVSSYRPPPLLRRLVTEASLCRSRRDLAKLAAQSTRELFQAATSAVLLVGRNGQLAAEGWAGVGRADSRSCKSFESGKDPVVTAVLDRQIAVHSGQLATPDEHTSTPIEQGLARFAGSFHYLAAPLYDGSGGLIGVVHVGRAANHPPFGDADLRWATALAGHLSANLARLPRQPSESAEGNFLSPRERQVATLVTQGSTNPQIALALQISRETVKKTLQRVYCKLDVNGRAQMAGRLVELGCLWSSQSG